MPALTIRNLPEHVHAALRLQAAQGGLSMEAEGCKILTEACKTSKKRVEDACISAINLSEVLG